MNCHVTVASHPCKCLRLQNEPKTLAVMFSPCQECLSSVKSSVQHTHNAAGLSHLRQQYPVVASICHHLKVDSQDDARGVATEVREVFRQRKDKLQERRSWPLKDTTWEVLAPGARGALKQATLVKGLRRDLLFYHQVSYFIHSLCICISQLATHVAVQVCSFSATCSHQPPLP